MSWNRAQNDYLNPFLKMFRIKLYGWTAQVDARQPVLTRMLTYTHSGHNSPLKFSIWFYICSVLYIHLLILTREQLS